MFDNLYCKLFVSTDKSIDQLSDKIGETLKLAKDKYNSLANDYYVIDVILNKEYDEEKSKEFPDGFLYFNYFLDIDCTKNEYEKEYIDNISYLMNYLWKEGMKIVAACDFEEILPNNGGYNKPINY